MRGDRNIGLSQQDAARRVAEGADVGGKRPGRADEAGCVVDRAGLQTQRAAAGKAALAGGIARRVGVGQGLAVRVDTHRAAGLHEALVVSERAGIERDRRRGSQRSQRVVERAAVGVDFERVAGDPSLRIDESGIGQRRVARCLHSAGRVDGDAGGRQGQIACDCGHRAARVVEAGSRNRGVAVGCNGAADVARRTRDVDVEVARSGERCAIVVEAASPQHRVAARADHACVAVVQQAGGGEFERSRARRPHATALVVQRCRCDAQIAVAGDAAAAVVQRAIDCNHCGCPAGLDDRSTAIAERSCLHRQMLRRDAAAALFEVSGDVGDEHAIRRDLAACAAIAVGIQTQRAGSRVLELAAGIGERARGNGQVCAVARDRAAVVRQRARGNEVRRPRARLDDRPTPVANIARIDRDLPSARGAAVLDEAAGFDDQVAV